MSDFVYCGTYPPVDANGTQQLLREFGAIWFPRSWGQMPSSGDRLWLVWHSSIDAITVLIGGGKIAITESGNIRWTNGTLPGVTPYARDLGYAGPTNMSFLRLNGVVFPPSHAPVNLGKISNGLSLASSAQIKVLMQLLPIPEAQTGKSG